MADEFDEPTTAYLHQLTCDLGPPRRSPAYGQLPIGSVESFEEDAVVNPRATVPPFYGNELARWARECLTSPYARKALVFAHEAGLADRIEVVHHETSPTLRNETVYAQNPLG